jgi:tRNA pseudouridine32 synthase/23S rRNA pseudouridine746 synthase
MSELPRHTLPPRDGVGPSVVRLPAGDWPTILAFLVERFPHVDAASWRARMERGLVCDESGTALDESSPYRAGLRVQYYRELAHEPVIAEVETILFQDEHLLVADKPHFLVVAPSGRYARETLLARLRLRTGLEDLAPLHRLDRDTAGVVAFSTNLATRSQYQALLRTHRADKIYEAVAPALPDLSFPLVRRSRLVPGEPFFRMRETDGEPNSETTIEAAERRGDAWLYRLRPRTGKTHQLRVHLAALGAPIVNDVLYPQLRDEAQDISRPLQLLARELAFDDPITGARRMFRSARQLAGAIPPARSPAPGPASGN